VTDRNTDRQTHDDGIYRVSIALLGKNASFKARAYCKTKSYSCMKECG